MFSQSLDALSKTLRRDMYSLQDPGSMVENGLDPDPDPLGSIRYSCLFWVDHLCKADDQRLVDCMSDDGAIFTFLGEHFLHWLESLSLIHKLSDGVLSIRKLLHKVQVCQILTAYNYTLMLSDNSLNLLQVPSLSDT